VKHITGLDRHQALLLPETIEDYIAPDNPVRFLDAFVGSLDLFGLGFSRALPASTGRPPYQPADLLRLYLYGYLHRIRSSRALERECHRNLELIWLMGKLAPDFKTIADFRREHRACFKAVHQQFHLLCRKLGLFGGQLVALDGTKLAAVNARQANFNQNKLEELLARADARLEEYLKELDAADATEADEEKLTRAQLEEKIAALREKKDWHEELLGQLQDREQKQISTTDADARKMHASQGTVIGYNAQSAVDDKHKLIVAEEVTNEVTDSGQLSQLATDAKETLGGREARSGSRPRLLQHGRGEPVRPARYHSLYSESQHQRQHRARLLCQERFCLRQGEGPLPLPRGRAIDLSLQHL